MNFDGLIGPTHNYGGLSFGNLASMHHKSLISNPKEAALQGVAKMRLLHKLGIPQGVIPPHERPYLPLFYEIGYRGTGAEVLQQVLKDSLELLITASSAASMWTANAATVSPSSDSEDGLVHITPANLVSKFHRSFEAAQTSTILKKIFPNPKHFIHHPPLPASADFADEGAANHSRFCTSYKDPGVQLFVYGRHAFQKDTSKPKLFPARQSFEASQAIARLHRIPLKRVIFAQQNPELIDQGVFHNDVISVGNENVFFTHEKAFGEMNEVLKSLTHNIDNLCLIQVQSEQVSTQEAVRTYLFNSQLVTVAPSEMALIAPIECQESEQVSKFLSELMRRKDHPIRHIHYLNLRESMQNGGGPACLRLRVVLNDQERKAVHSPIIFTDKLDGLLVNWIERHYRDRLHPKELGDPQLLVETQSALDELTVLLQLGSIYSFQK